MLANPLGAFSQTLSSSKNSGTRNLQSLLVEDSGELMEHSKYAKTRCVHNAIY